MTTPAAPEKLDPMALQDRADQDRRPYVLCDHWVSRRQRLHVLYMPHQDKPFFATSLLRCLQRAVMAGLDDVTLVNTAENGNVLSQHLRTISSLSER